MKELNLAELQEVQLNILKNVDKFCSENNVQYSLSFGTLLGAVRHKGYIPWDDDIDIMMPRPHYDKFINEFNNFSHTYKVKSRTTDLKFPFTFAKVEDTTTKLDEKTDLSFDIGVNIDVFPVEGVPNKISLLKWHLFRIYLLKSVLTVKKIKIDFSTRSRVKNTILLMLKGLFKPISYVWILNKINNLLLKYDYSKSDYVMIASDTEKACQRMERKDFKEYTSLYFEDCAFNAISNHHKFLKLIYGDYMQPPPLEDQLTHHDYRAYK